MEDEKFDEFVRRLKEIISKREKETMEDIIGRGLTSVERDRLHSQVKNKLTDVIDRLVKEYKNGN